MKPCNLVEIERFGRISYVQLHLLFPEDGSSRFLSNVGTLLSKYDVMSQKTAIFVFIAVRTSVLTKKLLPSPDKEPSSFTSLIATLLAQLSCSNEATDKAVNP
jgi:hypothetical protein